MDIYSLSTLTACPGCDLLIVPGQVPPGRVSRCPRCGMVLRRTVGNSVQKAVAMSLAGLILFVPAVTLPIMTFSVAGLHGSGSVVEAALILLRSNDYFIGSMVLLVSLLFPLLKLGLLFNTSAALSCGYAGRPIISTFRLARHLSEWGMAEVYLLGILVSIIKLHAMGSIDFDFGFFCFLGMTFLVVAAYSAVDEETFWRYFDKTSTFERKIELNPKAEVSAHSMGLVRCHDCGKLVFDVRPAADETARCPRCHAMLHGRKPDSLSKTWALVLAAAAFYLPANLLPMMRVDFMGTPDEETILEGIIYFFQTGDFLVGGIILTASVLVPLFKIVGIVLILCSIHFRWHGWLRHKATMFRFIEFIGRWSFLDIFVIALLASLVQFGSVMTIRADPAAPYFTAVVLSTMFAALTFDPRLLWDRRMELLPQQE